MRFAKIKRIYFVVVKYIKWDVCVCVCIREVDNYTPKGIILSKMGEDNNVNDKSTIMSILYKKRCLIYIRRVCKYTKKLGLIY